MEIVVPPEHAGERLDVFLARSAGSRTAAQRLLEGGAVLVDGRERPKRHAVAAGERIVVSELPEPERAEVPDAPYAIAWEDEHLLVVDKPAGVVVHPAPGHHAGTLVHGLLQLGAEGGEQDRPGIVHRLDRDTSGLLVVARSAEAYERLKRQVAERELERTYLALVRGRPRSRRGRIEAPTGRDRSDPMRHSLDTDSPREAITHFEVERLFDHHALLRVRLETGRTHQIRVHLAAIDLPVSGDTVYGVPEPGLRRQFLHATKLAFAHPITGERVEAESPLPGDLTGFLSRI